MRLGLVIAAVAAAGMTVPAEAATIVQTDNEEMFRGFDGFDSRLGTLLGVTLDIVLNKRRVWQVDASVPVGTSKAISYSVDGQWLLPGSFLLQTDPYIVALTGSGSTVVALNQSAGDRAFGYFSTFVTGRASLALDPGGFVDRRRSFNGYDVGHFDATGADTTLTTTGSARFQRIARSCNMSDSQPWIAPFEDLCGGAGYRLTYLYDPIPTSGVPEPATWAMMLFGFAGIGYGMRRRHGAASRVRLASA